jgi:nucleotide-binding universal stress UspA family protein
MGLIICATRGGDASIPTQERAILEAKERGDELVFLYVVDSSFLNKTAAAVVVNVEDELSDMGEFILAMAVERAAEQGVSARAEIRKGVVRELLPEVTKELGAEVIVIGRPVGGTGRFDVDEFSEYADQLAEESNAEVIVQREIPTDT